MSVSSTSKICLIAVGLVLIACNVVCIAWLFMSKAQNFTQSPTPMCRIMSSDYMPSVLGNISSKAHCFLKVSKDDNYTTDNGPVKWVDDISRGISLDESGTRIIVDSDGYYIVSVQAIFILENYTGDNRLRIQLRTDDKDDQSPVAAWDEREVKDQKEGQALRLSFLVLLELVKGQYIIVDAKHRNRFDYNTPISTFLTMVKYSNL